MKKSMHSVLAAALLATLLVVGCANQKEPASKAVADAEATLATFRDEASRYAASELQSTEAAIASMKASLDKGDYKAVVAGSPAVSTQLESLRKTTTDKKAEAEAANEAARSTWATMSEDLPKMVAAIQSRVDVLAKSKKLPKNLAPASFESAKTGLDEMKAIWTEATTAASAGNAVEAVSRAEAARAKGTEVMTMLGMQAAAG
jgi:PBP1b-binding outer membrane lipoprotein LpoB